MTLQQLQVYIPLAGPPYQFEPGTEDLCRCPLPGVWPASGHLPGGWRSSCVPCVGGGHDERVPPGPSAGQDDGGSPRVQVADHRGCHFAAVLHVNSVLHHHHVLHTACSWLAGCPVGSVWWVSDVILTSVHCTALGPNTTDL
jgi:hypothetical protein